MIPGAERIVFALDVPNYEGAAALLRCLATQLRHVKIGLELFSAAGPKVVEYAQYCGYEVVLDLKLHDIPETVERSFAVHTALGVKFSTVHALSGPEALNRVAKTAMMTGTTKPLIVTVLTSLDDNDLELLGFQGNMRFESLVFETTQRLTRLAGAHPINGLVCSPKEVDRLRPIIRGTMMIPGIRLTGTDVHDQKRVGTAFQAIADGADLLVVGRPIRDAEDPEAVIAAFANEIQLGSIARNTALAAAAAAKETSQ